MGYSNNKWRKILTILMIINLCFILFARFIKVFGANEPSIGSSVTITRNSNNVDYVIELPSWINNYYWAFIYRDSSNYCYFNLYASQSPITVSFDNNGKPTLYGNNIAIVSGGSRAWNSITNVISSSVEPSSFNNASLTVGTGFQTGQVSRCACNHNIKNKDNNEIVYNDSLYNFVAPYFDNINEIESGSPDGVFISRGDFSYNDTLYFHLLKITYTVSDNNNTIYYYSPKIFALNKDSEYYQTWNGDTDNNLSYYYIPRYNLGLDPNSSYLYVLSNSSESYTNSYGILEENIDNGIYDIIQSDTTGVITSQDSINDKIQNIDDTINDNTVSGDTETNIEDSLNFNNQNEGLNNLNNGFFSRLTSMLSNLLGYNLGEDTSVSIPLPNSDNSIVLHSKIIYDNVTGALRLIINAFWVYIFSFYMWKFINKIYIAVSTGNILDTFSSSGEAITNDML